MKKIITCDLPLPIQRLYIKRLKHMIERWEFDGFCSHCPVHKNFEECVEFIKKLKPYDCEICHFCKDNVEAENCPCYGLGPKKALTKAKDFIKRFEAEQDSK